MRKTTQQKQSEAVLEELYCIGLGQKRYTETDKNGEEFLREPAIGERLKALELYTKCRDNLMPQAQAKSEDMRVKIVSAQDGSEYY